MRKKEFYTEIPLDILFKKAYTENMANGEEDLKEKNKDHKKPTKGHYSSWETHYGREDAEMLFEKSKKEYDDYND